MTDRDLLMNLSLVAGTLLRHPQSIEARRAVRSALEAVRQNFEEEARKGRSTEPPRTRKTGWLPYRDD